MLLPCGPGTRHLWPGLLQYCLFISMLPFLLLPHPNPFSTLWGRVISWNMWIGSYHPLLSIPHCLSATDSFQYPRTLHGLLLSLISHYPAPSPPRPLLYPSAVPPLERPFISFAPISLVLVIFSAYSNLPYNTVFFCGELVLQVSA